MIRIHYLQHVPFETPARIADWAAERGHRITGTRLFAGVPLPSLDSFDTLVAMGGPMSVHDEANHPWLVEEKRLIGGAIRARKRVLGVCLGAQLVADVMGARVHRNAHKEIGWFPVVTTDVGESHPVFALPRSFMAYHWHGETFDLPSGAVRLAGSEACVNQMFAVGNTVLGIQFHLEMTRSGVEDLIANGASDLDSGPFVQSPRAMLSEKVDLQAAHRLLDSLLDRWCAEQ